MTARAPRLLFPALFALAASVASAQRPAPPAAAARALEDRAAYILDDVRYLASDALAGRFTGSPGNDSAAAYIARRFRQLGLAPGGDDGTWFQGWTVGSTASTRQVGVAGRATRNVVAILPAAGGARGAGDGAGGGRRTTYAAGQAVVVGAHFDHLGLGPFGSMAPDSAGRVHNGADDNASGTAAVLEIARILATTRPRPARTVVFVLFSGEELGALGSAYYADHPAVPLDSTLAMINLDMVGRLRNGRLLVLGVRSAIQWQGIVDSVNAAYGLDVRASGDGWGPSDQASFFARKRPVLHLFTDLHEDYHRPSDDWDRINAAGIARVAAFTADLVRRLADRPGPLTFVDAPPPPAPTAASGERAYLGTIPDMTDEPGGVRLSGVRAGSPAEAAGLVAGDIIVEMAGTPIRSLQEMSNALVARRPGDRIEIRVRRGDSTVTVSAVLGRRGG